jgi:Zn-dependent oligopeptidase
MEEDKNNSKKYLTNPDGSYILKKDGTPRLRPGRPKNSELSGLKLALQAKKKLTKKNKKVKKLTRSLARVKKELDKEEKVLTSNVLTESETKKLPEAVQEHIDQTGSNVYSILTKVHKQTSLLLVRKMYFMVELLVVVNPMLC